MAVPTMTNNSPTPGYIAWGSFTIQLYGVAYTVSAGSTNQRWVWWEYKNGAPIINAGAAVPDTLVDDDLVLFANKNGIGVRVQSTSYVDGELLVDGSIFAEALSTNLINSNHIVTVGLDAAVIKFGEMSGDRIMADTITANEIATDTITANEIATDTITANEIATDTITANEIATNAITSNEISATAIDGRLIYGAEIFGGRITTDDPLTDGVQMILEEYSSTEFSKSGALRFVTGESGIMDGILLGQRTTSFLGAPNDVSRMLLLRPPGVPSGSVASMEKPSLTLTQRSGSPTDLTTPPIGGGSSAGMFGPVVGISARPSVTGSGTTFDGGLLLYTHSGSGGDPEARIRLGAKIAHVHTKDTGGTFRERSLIDTIQSRLSSPDTLDYVSVKDTGTQVYVNGTERLRIDDDESMLYSANHLNYVLARDDGIVLSGPTFLGGSNWPHAIRHRNADLSIPNTTFTVVNTNLSDELSGGLTYSAGTWTIPMSGRYLCACSVQFAANATGRRVMQLVRNGVPVFRKDGGSSTQVTSIDISVPMRFNANDTFEFQVWQNSGGPLVLNGAQVEYNVAVISWLGT